MKSDPIAVVGMSCLFPGSLNLDTFWHNMREGSTYVRDVPADRWNHAAFYSPDRRNTDTTYARKIAYLDDIRSFGPEQYGMPPRRAYPMDPQQRLFLDQTRMALNDAGYRGRPLPKSTGVYVGASGTEYRDLVVSRLRARQLLGGEWGRVPSLPGNALEEIVRSVAPVQKYTMVGLLMNMIACNVSGVFDLQGPALVTDAACSSALLAIHSAVLHLRTGICDAAIVGGVYTICTPDLLIGFSRIGALSGNDVCRPFDEGADGFVLGEGVGVVVLKRLEDALRDKDHIWAVVRGVGLNNDGHGEGPMTPRLSGQVDALARGYRDAGISPDTVGYIEAHGTATPVGDLTEIAALKMNVKTNGEGPVHCAVASVKGNIGHSLAASGIAGLIRAVLAVKHGVIPPQAGLQSVRAELGLQGSGYYIPAVAQPFEARPGLPRRAGVSAFGFGGTNVHVVIEQSPETHRNAVVAVSNPEEPQLFVISAATPVHLTQHLNELAEAIGGVDTSLSDLAYTLTAGRRRESACVAFVARSRPHLLEMLKNSVATVGKEQSGSVYYAGEPLAEPQRKIAFLFPDQGMAWSQDGSNSFRRFPPLQARLEAIVASMNGNFPSLSNLRPATNGDRHASDSTMPAAPGNGLPALAAVQLALVEFFAALGLRPNAAMGLGLGELIAAAAAGVLEERAALHLVAQFSSELHSSPSVGLASAISESMTRLKVSASRIPVISSVTGSPYPKDAPSIAKTLTRGCTESLDLEKAISCLRSTGANIFIQMGGNPMPVDLVRAIPVPKSTDPPHIINLFNEGNEPCASLLGALGQLVTLGVPLNLSSLFGDSRLTSLPSPPFPSHPYWIVSKSRKSGRPAGPPLATLDDGSDEDFSESKQGEADSFEPIATGVASEYGDSSEQKVLGLIVQLTAFPIESLKPEMQFGADLGFDSLMWMDLYDSLLAAIPETRELPQSLIRVDTTVGDLIREVSAVVSRSEQGAQHGPAKDEIQRYGVVPVDLPLASEPHGTLQIAGPVQLVADARGVAPILARRLESAGFEVRTVLPGDRFVRDGVQSLIDLTGLDAGAQGGDAAALRGPVMETLRRASAMAAGASAPSAFLTVYSGIRNSGMAGLAKALAHEWPTALVRSLETEPGAAADVIAEQVLAELAGKDQPIEVSYASGSRQVLGLERKPIDYRALPEGVIVAISGGGRGLGAKLAVELARRHKARLLLLGRSPDCGNTIQSVLDAGGMALYVKCDVRNEAEVRAAFQKCREDFGPIQHVVHAAGILADESIETKNLDRAAVVYDTKVAGGLALWEAAKTDPLGTFLIYGSWAGRFGNAHQSDYSAANHLLGRLASVLGAERPAVRVITMDLPPWEGSGMINELPESVRRALRSRIRFLTDETGLAHVLAEMGAEGASGEVVIGAGLEEKSATDRSEVIISRTEQPWLDDHRLDGRIFVPLAVSLDYAAVAAARLGIGPGLALSDIQVSEALTVPETGATRLGITAVRNGEATEIGISSVDHMKHPPSVRLRATTVSDPLAVLVRPPDGNPHEMSVAEFYERLNFHGPRFRVLKSVLEVGTGHAVGQICVPDNRECPASVALDVLALDGMMQLCAYWAFVKLGVTGLPVGADQIRILARPQTGSEHSVIGLLRPTAEGVMTCDLDLLDQENRPLIQVRGLRCKLVERRARLRPNGRGHGVPLTEIDSSSWRIEEFPEVKALKDLVQTARTIGLESPYFSVHERVTNETSIIGGREYVNFASYNYLGLSGNPEITAAAVEAMNRYGTSVSASRLVSGEKPLHGELECEIAEFLGCEDSVVFVSGHATNVSVIGHMFGPQDLVIHDSLAHDSILTGIRLSGAKRHAFPHNDPDALDEILRQTRNSARRVLIAVEAVYSMDGDIAPLARIIEIKRRHKALLLVDEAHSLGVLGRTGRGIGEHCGVRRSDVEFWMGTLSKSLASCGGYIAGSKELVNYLKHTNPGFVYSVGMSPANAAAALAALRKLRASPNLVATLRERSRLFLDLSRKHGINTGSSEGTPIVPCIVGSSLEGVRLSRAMLARGINVQPILHPAVEENMVRLRFFITTRHSEQQIRAATEALAEELEKINPRHLAVRPSVKDHRNPETRLGA